MSIPRSCVNIDPDAQHLMVAPPSAAPQIILRSVPEQTVHTYLSLRSVLAATLLTFVLGALFLGGLVSAQDASA